MVRHHAGAMFPSGSAPVAGSALSSEDATLVARLRQREESAFVTLIDRFHAPLVRFLRNYLPDADAADEIAQETWIAVLEGVGRFEGRSSLKTWLFRIGANRAQTRMRRERRTVPFASLGRGGGDDDADIDAERLLPAAFDPASGSWKSVPARWDEEPETRLTSDETVALVQATIQLLPPMQAAVVTLRDIEQWSAAEVREALDLSEANQRVLLHRARARLRKALELHLEGGRS